MRLSAFLILSWFSCFREKMGCRVWQVYLKCVYTSSQVFSSVLNFSGWKNQRIESKGSIRQVKAIMHMMIEEIAQEFLICKSKMISPKGLQSKVKSSSFMEKRESQPAMLEFTLDRLSRLYLSTQQQRDKPRADRNAPKGMREEQRKVNHMISMISAYRLPILYCTFSMILLAYFWVRSFLPSLSFLLIRTWICQGLISHMNGTNSAFIKNIMLSSSITPQECSQKLWKRMSSTARVMSAVVKNIPTEYFKAKWNYSSAVVGCLQKSHILCKTCPITNLLKKITQIKAKQTRKMAAWYWLPFVEPESSLA